MTAGEQSSTVVLLACCEPDDRAALTESLGRDFALECATCAGEALRVFGERHPAAVLYGLDPAGLRAFLEGLRSEERSASALVFALAAQDDEDAQVAAFEHGADGVIARPVNPRLVRARLTSALRNRGAAEARSQEVNDQLRFLNETARFLLVGADPDTAIRRALEKIREHFDGDRARIFELDDEREEASNTYEACAAGVR